MDALLKTILEAPLPNLLIFAGQNITPDQTWDVQVRYPRP